MIAQLIAASRRDSEAATQSDPGCEAPSRVRKAFASAANAFTVSAFLLSTCSVFAGEQHAIPAVFACNRRASTQPCEFGAGHAFQSFPLELPWIRWDQIL